MTNLEIETFLTICWHKSISKAAEALYISQSSLSTRLKKLEQEIGCQLVARRNGARSLELTPEGAKFYEYACQYRELTRQMLAVSHSKGPEQLRISVVNSIGAFLFPPVYGQFLRQYPQYRLEIQEADNVPALANKKMNSGLVDLMFHSDIQPSETLHIFPVFSEPMVLICSTDSPYPELVNREELLIDREIFTKWSDTQYEWHQNMFGQDTRPLVHLEIMSNFRIFTSQPNCWAIVPLSVAEGIADNASIKICRTEFKIPKRVTYCVATQAARTMPSTQSFLACLHEELEKKPPYQLDILY